MKRLKAALWILVPLGLLAMAWAGAWTYREFATGRAMDRYLQRYSYKCEGPICDEGGSSISFDLAALRQSDMGCRSVPYLLNLFESEGLRPHPEGSCKDRSLGFLAMHLSSICGLPDERRPDELLHLGRQWHESHKWKHWWNPWTTCPGQSRWSY